MEILSRQCEDIVGEICADEKLEYSLSYLEDFPATVNSERCVELIEKSANENNFEVLRLTKPNNWSEDFGYYTNNYPGGYLGIGAGENHPALHNPDYDFPDEIIDTGVKMYYNIYHSLNH